MQSTGHTAVQDASLQHACVMTYGTHPPIHCLLPVVGARSPLSEIILNDIVNGRHDGSGVEWEVEMHARTFTAEDHVGNSSDETEAW
jgi:hypothetical protein